jgi:hypothetical protein
MSWAYENLQPYVPSLLKRHLARDERFINQHNQAVEERMYLTRYKVREIPASGRNQSRFSTCPERLEILSGDVFPCSVSDDQANLGRSKSSIQYGWHISFAFDI